jgi:hypothetical protein
MKRLLALALLALAGPAVAGGSSNPSAGTSGNYSVGGNLAVGGAISSGVITTSAPGNGLQVQDTQALAAGIGGQILLQATNTAPAQVTYAAVKASAVSGTPGAEAGTAQICRVSVGVVICDAQLFFDGGFVVGSVIGTSKGASTINTNAYYVAGNLLASSVAPTIASGGCTTGSAQSVSGSNGSAAFELTLGGASCGSTITLTMPAAAHNWQCDGYQEAALTNYLVSTGAKSTTAVVLTNVVRTTGVAGAFTGATLYAVKCLPY